MLNGLMHSSLVPGRDLIVICTYFAQVSKYVAAKVFYANICVQCCECRINISVGDFFSLCILKQVGLVVERKPKSLNLKLKLGIAAGQ